MAEAGDRGCSQVLTSASLIHFCFPRSLPVVPHHRWSRTGAQVHLSPQRGGFQKQRTLSSGVYTSLYKIIKSSINTQLYTEPNPRPVELGRGVREGECPIWGQMRVEVPPPCRRPPARDQHRGLELVTSGSSREGILPAQVCMWGEVSEDSDRGGVLQPGSWALTSPSPRPSSLAKCNWPGAVAGVLPGTPACVYTRQWLEQRPAYPGRHAVCCSVVSGTLEGLALLRPPRQ